MNIIIVILILLPLIIGTLIGYLTNNKYDKERYKMLKKPKYQPPNITFSIIWPILYILIGISYYLGLKNKKIKYWIIPIIGIIINFSYTPIFFGTNKLLISLIIVLLTLIFAILTFIQFYKTNKSKLASYLLLPYILWLIFALILSIEIYNLNKKKLST
tara:strand:+ start:1317 stop:1793 length:477 start_codon:yes stop_codon:yes gene_type:complete